MIPRSLAAACIAIFLSLLAHFFGILTLLYDPPVETVQTETTDAPASSGDFADVAETLVEPVEPEAAETPEPPEEITPEAPTSLAEVAAENPQDQVNEDAALAEVATPDTADSPDPEETAAGEPDASDAAEEAPDAQQIIAEQATEQLDQAQPPSQGQPDAAPEPTELESADSEVTETASTNSDNAETIASIAIPLELETLQPVLPNTAIEPETESLDTEDTPDEIVLSHSAVARSLRPPSQRPSAEQLGVPEERLRRTTQRPVIQSPLTAYKRDGVDLIARGLGGSSIGGLGTFNARGAGNSGSTNYVGRVLSKLNRAPVVYGSASGTARVYFEIRADGSLAWVRVISSKGSQDIDTAAKAQVRSAAPFPRPPQGASQRLVFVYRNN